ncbi:sugar transferase [Candidatus Gottesmanbacteria bacterium]|nr:sugar transferase [Candidatus Gottesmanbacteria bacterium]
MISVFYHLTVMVIFLVSLPLQVLIAILIMMMSGLPIVFRQKRTGKNGAPFVMYKFRTMVNGAEKKKPAYAHLNESQGPAFKIRKDPRFTGIGAFLSHTGLDELPQLFNVLRGDMALIGPRPLPIAEAQKLKPWMRVREQILPGIISPAILTGKYHENFDSWMRSDVSYVKKKNAIGDVRLFLQSFSFLARLFVRSMGMKQST